MSATDDTDLYAQRERLLDLLREYQEAIVLEDDPRRVFSYSREVERVKDELGALTSLIEAKEAARSLESIQADVSTIRDEIDAPNLVSSLEAKLGELTSLFEQTIEQSRARALASSIEPRLSVIRPSVKLIDANLAYKYADLQSDMNILFGLATLFLGAGISAGVSLGIGLSTNAQANVIAIHSAVLSMSVLVAGVFGWLTYRSYRKASEARTELEADAEVSEIATVPRDRRKQEE